MITEVITQIIDSTINSFDFGYCVAVNILTYLTIRTIDEVNGDKPVSTWMKRVILFACSVGIAIVYIISGRDLTNVINSFILAPVFWSWIGKPICDKLGIGYRKW